MGCLDALSPRSFSFPSLSRRVTWFFSPFLFEGDVRFMEENAKSHASQAGLSHLTVWQRLTLNLWFFCLSLLNPSRGYKRAPPCLLHCRVRNRAWGLVHVRPAVCQSSHILRHYVFLFHSESLSPLFLGVIWTFHSERTNFFLLSRND